jgi:hypothetical protein
MPAVVNTNLLVDPTNPQQAQVQGITPAAKPQAVPTMEPQNAAVVTSPTTVPPAGIAPVPPAATATQATAGVAPVSSVDTSSDLPALRDDSVQARVAAITGEDSPLMKQARTAGLQLANARGVLNSSIAAGASEAEAIRAATPIASQEAAQAAQSNSQRYDLSNQMARMRAQAGFESQARGENYSYTAALNTQGYAYQAQQAQNQQQFEKDMAAIQQGNAVDLANLQSTLQSKLQSQANTEQIQRMGVDLANQLQVQAQQSAAALNQIAAQGDVQLKLQTNQFQEALKELTLTLNQQNSLGMANAAVNLFQAEAGLRASLLSNENIPAAERAAYEQQISNLTAPTRNYISSVLGYVPQGSTSTPAPAPTPPATGGIAPQSQWSTYLTNNPDVAAGYQSLSSSRQEALPDA